jgi:hypothetical protein
MKTVSDFLSTILLFALLFCTLNLAAQSHSEKTINKKGEIIISDGSKIGYLDSLGNVFNSKGERLGKIDPAGVVTNASGKKIGEVKNGKYTSIDGKSVITTKSQGEICEVYDEHGHKLGSVHNNYKLHACAIHCFYKEEELKKKK